MLLSAVAIGATSVFGRTVTPAPEPTAPPTVQPSVPPTTPPATPPSVDPSLPPGDGVFVVDLTTLTDHDVSISVDDETGSVVDVTTGTPGDGMSVRWFDPEVENIDAETLRVVWVGLPRDEVVRLGVSRVDGKVRLRFVQDAPLANSDALGFDRVLNMRFVVPVRAEDVLRRSRRASTRRTDPGRRPSTPRPVSGRGVVPPDAVMTPGVASPPAFQLGEIDWPSAYRVPSP